MTTTNGITSIGDQGLGQQPWWVEQWMELINGYPVSYTHLTLPTKRIV